MSPPVSGQPGPIVHGAGGVEVATYFLGGEGPAVLLAHATGFHGRCWLPLASPLTETYSVWTFDHRGHGASGRARDGRYDRWELFALDVLAVVDALGLADVLGAGHSLGGAALLLAEQARPATFAGLYLYEPIVFPPERAVEAPDETRLSVLAKKRRERFGSYDEARTNFAGKLPFSRFDPAVLDAYVRYGFVEEPDGTVVLACPRDVEASVYHGAVRHRAFEHLGQVAPPVVVAGGAAGGDISPQVLAEVADRLPHARVQMHDGLSHFGPMEDPDRLGRAIRDHFIEVTTKPA